VGLPPVKPRRAGGDGGERLKDDGPSFSSTAWLIGGGDSIY